MNYNSCCTVLIHPSRTGKLEELAGVGENYDGNLGFTENGKFLSLLEQPGPPLREHDLSAVGIVDSFDLDLPSTHWLNFSLSQSTNMPN